jgi:hypothetical protein
MFPLLAAIVVDCRTGGEKTRGITGRVCHKVRFSPCPLRVKSFNTEPTEGRCVLCVESFLGTEVTEKILNPLSQIGPTQVRLDHGRDGCANC